jgi:hypothetical protein
MRAEYGLFRHYYRDYALPAAESMAQRLRQDYTTVQQDYPGFIQGSGYFDNVLKDVIHVGYVGINHKLESFMAFINAHVRGRAYGPLGAHPGEVIRYDTLLRERYDILLDDFVGKEPAVPVLCDSCAQPVPPRRSASPRPILYPRVHRIRLIANRVKHQSGYVRNENDQLMEALFEQETNRPIRVPVQEFLHDLAYADAYLFLLTRLVTNAYLVAYMERIFQEPVTDRQGHEEVRARLESHAQQFERDLANDVNEYHNRHIDTLNLVA